jgi:hypothetical protein
VSNTKNNYYIWIQPYDRPIAWDISLASPLPELKYGYFSQTFQEFEKISPLCGLTFYITHDNIQELPSYGNNVVAIIVGDESCCIPRYSEKVLAVFKCYGTWPTSLIQWKFSDPHFLFASINKFAFDRLRWMKFEIASQIKSLIQRKSLLSRSKRNIFLIPLGYHQQVELPIKNIHERIYDTSFLGSVAHGNQRFSIKNLIKNPKKLSRESLVTTLERCEERSKFKIFLSSFSGFFDPNKFSPDIYSEILMESKICVAPQGTSLETFRFFEGMRYGCIVIAESLPSHWFYEESPVVKISSWKDLEDLISELLSDVDLMNKKHEESLAWWNSKCSEVVLSKYIDQTLRPLCRILALH